MVPDSLFIILIYYYLLVNRGVTDQFINGYALFYDTWAPLAEAAIYIITAVVGGYLCGLDGVLLGNVISTVLVIYIWKPFFLFTKGFCVSVWHYWKEWLKYVSLFIVSCVLSEFIVSQFNIIASDGWGQWIVIGFCCTIIEFIIYGGMLLLFTTGARDFMARIIIRIKK